MRSLYLLIDFLVIIAPFIASFSPRIRFYRLFVPFVIASLCVGLLFISWDVLFAHLGVWDFNSRYVEGIYFLHLPIEEILFFTCIPFSCVFTYYCLEHFGRFTRIPSISDRTGILIVTLLLVMAVIFHDRLYTGSTFISAAFACLVVKLFGKGSLLARCLITYLVLLVPFFLVNGVLTGTGLPEPIVRYNNAENLGIRLLTIPIEDVFYGFSLVSLNITLFELFAGRMLSIT